MYNRNFGEITFFTNVAIRQHTNFSMATRSRTLLFLKYRNTFARNHSRPLATSSGYDAYNTSEQAGLIESSDHVIELTVLPPKW